MELEVLEIRLTPFSAKTKQKHLSSQNPEILP